MSPLAQELQKEEYQGLTHEQAASVLNSKSSTSLEAITQNWLLMYVASRNLLGPMMEVAEGRACGHLPALPPEHGLRNACLALVTFLRSGSGRDLFLGGAPENLLMMSGLVAAGLITEQHKQELLAKGTKTLPLWQTLGLSRPVDWADIQAARSEAS